MEILRDQIARGFQDVHRRLDDQKEQQTERHSQNIGNFGRLDTDIRSLMATATTLSGTVAGHTHDIRSLVLQGTPVTVKSLRLYIGIATGAVVGFVWLLHTLGLLK